MISSLRNLKLTLKHIEPDRVPVAIWSCALWYLKKIGINVKDYYQSIDLKLQTQISLQEKYTEVLMFPGIWPDFGVAAEPSAFGCPIHWPSDDAPVARPAITSMNEVNYIKPVSIKTAGLFPKVLETYNYFLRNVNEKFIDDYEQLSGMIFFLGPIETAALIRGYSEFLLELYDNPRLVHKLLNIVTDTLIDWIYFLEKRIGKIKRLFMADHFASQVSKDQCLEFVFPYIKKIFSEFPNALKLYHNEGPVKHVLKEIAEIKADIFHFGTDVRQTKNEIGDKICLLGNLDPVKVLCDKTPAEITKNAMEVMEVAAKGGGFILSTAGAFGINVPNENIDALIEAPNKYEIKKRGGM